MVRRALSFLGLSAAIAACDPAAAPEDFVCSREQQRMIPLWQRPAVDVLVVLDRSPSMADQAADVQRLAETTRAVLETGGGVPDMHLAVVTTDLGASGVAGCDAGAGDGGAFVGGARCGLDGAFLAARGLVGGGVRVNGSATLDEALTCLYDVPLSTCPVSQPLAAAVRALDGSVAGNAGFRRDYAGLFVLIVTDGDDCSLAHATALADVVAPADLEGAIDFACFARGTACSPSDPTAAGVHTGCVSRDDAGISDVNALWSQLQALAGDGQIALSTIAAGDAPLVSSEGRLVSACPQNGAAGPAPRLASIQTPERSWLYSVCEDWTDALVWLPQLLKVPLIGAPCLDSELDLDPATPGLQLHCVTQIVDEAGDRIAPLPWCDAVGADRSRPCIEVRDDPQGCPESGASLNVSLGDDRLPARIRADLRCEVPCE